jgi:phosphoribosylformylglycinamidine cyclo-ligase
MVNKSAYARAGVDFDVAASTKRSIARLARTTFRPEVLTGIGFFGSFYEFKGYQKPVLVSSVDGVGTKIKIASAMDQHESIGQDIVNHSVNDILCCGASPLYFLDYIAMGRLDPRIALQVVKGMTRACKAAGCSLVGGETAQMPGVYAEGEYDVVGLITGVVEKKDIIDGRRIRAGDIALGLPSNGLHTNGYSLVRKVFNLDRDAAPLRDYREVLGVSLGDALLRPHTCYYRALKPVLNEVRGLAHITGGGLVDNVPRVIPEGLAVRFDTQAWKTPDLFTLIQEKGRISRNEMFNVFNMGIGMVVICARSKVPGLLVALKGSKVIGEVVKAGEDEEQVIIE